MICPSCKRHTANSVLDSRPRENYIWRRRKCLQCNTVYTTRELHEGWIENEESSKEKLDRIFKKIETFFQEESAKLGPRRREE